MDLSVVKCRLHPSILMEVKDDMVLCTFCELNKQVIEDIKTFVAQYGALDKTYLNVIRAWTP